MQIQIIKQESNTSSRWTKDDEKAEYPLKLNQDQ